MGVMIGGLQSARLKIVRATEHLDAIKKVIKVVAESDCYEIVKDSNGREAVYFKGEPPTEISILVGEVVYQIRSAIDHLAFDLVKLNPSHAALPTNWEKNCCFPLWLVASKKGTGYNCFENTLPGITKDAFTFIEGVQPYHTGPGIHNVLRLVAQLSNVDKHRHLNITVPSM